MSTNISKRAHREFKKAQRLSRRRNLLGGPSHLRHHPVLRDVQSEPLRQAQITGNRSESDLLPSDKVLVGLALLFGVMTILSSGATASWVSYLDQSVVTVIMGIITIVTITLLTISMAVPTRKF